jgi:hypothetical protein
MASFDDLRDNFTDNSISPAWETLIVGSATVAETSGQLRCTLPSSTAGTHIGFLLSADQYSLVGSSFYINIDTMVATGVAAEADFDLVLDGLNYLRWRQLSNTITARKVVAGVDTQLFTATWSASTYKYLRIRETGGNIEFHSSTNGTAWTLRATITGLPFAVTALYVQFGASCGNIASPGSLRLEDVNLILPALSTNWRWQQQRWSLAHRYKVVTLAIDTAGTVQGYIVTADGVDASGDPSGNVRYWSGPTAGGRVLTEQTTQAAAEAMAVNYPVDGRFDLPTMVECRVIRTYNRSIDGSSYVLREDYARRLVQSDDIEAESIRAINIAAGAVTADNIFVSDLSAITANIGQLTITASTGDAWIYQGTGTGTAPTTGLKIFNSGGIGKLSTYNTGVEQVTFDTDGKLKAGAGAVLLDAGGISIVTPSAASTTFAAYKIMDGANVTGSLNGFESGAAYFTFLETPSNAATDAHITVKATAPTTKVSSVTIGALAPASNATIVLTARDSPALKDIEITATATSISGNTAIGDSVNSVTRLRVKGVSATSSDYALVVANSTPTAMLVIRNDQRIGVFGVTEAPRQTVTGSRGGNAALASFLTAMATYGWIIDSSSA